MAQRLEGPANKKIAAQGLITSQLALISKQLEVVNKRLEDVAYRLDTIEDKFDAHNNQQLQSPGITETLH